MSRFEDSEPPDELRDVEERLRAARPTFTELELDQLKLRALARASRGKAGPGAMRGKTMRSRILTLAVAALLLGGTAGGAIAGGGGDKPGNAASDQYRPGNGCGDKNHEHTGPPGNPGNDKCPPQAGGDEKGHTTTTVTTPTVTAGTSTTKGNGKK